MRLWVALAVAAGLVLGVPAAAAAQTAGQDSVTGTALACRQPSSGCLTVSPGFGTWLRLTAAAQSGPDGESPAGTVTWDERVVGAGIHSDTSVTCLSVKDNVAVVGVTGLRRTTLSVGSLDVSIAGLVRITDGGASGPDTLEFAIDQGPLVPPPPPPLPGPTDCSAFPAGLPVETADDEGDLVVTDARPLPTSKAQCRNGGWRTFGVFKNQGDCVSFVSHPR
jgi:hypothetical protein